MKRGNETFTVYKPPANKHHLTSFQESIFNAWWTVETKLKMFAQAPYALYSAIMEPLEQKSSPRALPT